MKSSAIAALSALALIVPPLDAFAGDVRITYGYLDMNERGVGDLRLVGDRFFSFQSRVFGPSGIFSPESCNMDPLDCVPGATVALTAGWSGIDLTGTAQLDMMTYDDVGGPNSPNQMLIAFSGSVVLPPLVGSTTVSAPFTFTGRFFHLNGPVETLMGNGTATLFLSQSPESSGFPGSWRVDRVLYRFASPVPPPWTTRDVGSVGITGNASYVEGTFYVDGSGADIWGTSDHFRFVYQPIAGDGEIVARMITEKPTNRFAKAGVMFRQSVDPSSAHVILNFKPDGEIEFLSRNANNGNTIYLGGAFATVPGWLKLARSGTAFSAFQSADGVEWIPIGSVDLPSAPSDLLTGLAVTSHDDALLNLAAFDHVTVTTPVPIHNLLQGGTFEEYVPPELGPLGWISDHLFRQTPAKSETNQPQSGAKNGACWTPERLDCGMYQEVRASISGRYTFRLYATSDRPGGLVGVNLNGVLAGSSQVEASGFGNYLPYAIPFEAQRGDIIRVWMYSPGTPGYVVIDDTSLRLDHAIPITEGRWEIGSSGPPVGRFTLSGDDVQITGSYDGGVVEAQTACSSTPCRPGQLVSLRSSFDSQNPLTIASFARGSATVGGTSYPFLEFGGTLMLSGGTVTLPTPPGVEFPGRVEISAPFTFTGDLKGFDVLMRRDPDLKFDLPLSGHGTATLELLTVPSSDGPVMNLYRLTYTFEP